MLFFTAPYFSFITSHIHNWELFLLWLSFAKKNGKLLALTECGLKNMTDPTWWTRVLMPVMDKYPVSYFLLWRNYSKEFFGPAPGLECAKDYQKLYEAANSLFLKDIQ